MDINLILGRLVVDSKFNNETNFRNKNTNLVTITDTYSDSKLPTQIIGWNKAEEIFNDNISILNKVVRPNVYWTFSPDEKMQDFNEDVSYFINQLYGDYIKQFEYYFIDPVIDNITKLKHIMRFITQDRFGCSYISDDYIYMFCEEDKLILGIDLNYYEKLGMKNDLIKEFIKTQSIYTLVEDYSDTGVFQSFRNYLETEIDKKYIPALAIKSNF